MSAQAEGGSIVFDIAIQGVDEAAKGFAKVGASMSKEGERIKKAIEATTDGFDDFRNSVDATLDTARIFGRQSSLMADAIEDNISDPALRAKLALERLQKETTKTAVAKRKMGDALGLAKVRFFEFMGGAERGGMALTGMKGAVLGLGAAIVGGLVASVKMGIDANSKLSKAFDGVVDQGKRVAATFGQILIGGTKASEGADKMTESLKGLEGWMKTNATSIRDTALSIAQGALTVVKYVGMVPLGIYTLFKGIGSAIGTFAAFFVGSVLPEFISGLDVLLSGIADTMESVIKFLPADAADAVFEVVQELRAGSISAAHSAAELRATFNVKESDWLSGFQDGVDATNAFTDSIDALDTALQGMKGQKIEIDVEAKAKPGGKTSKTATEAAANVLPGAAGAFAESGAMLGGAAMGVGETERQLSPMEVAAKAWMDNSDVVAASIQKTRDEMGKLNVETAAQDSLMGDLAHSVGGELAGGFLTLAGSVGEALGAFAAGTGTLKEFGDAILDTFGDIASSIGDFFLKTGLGMMFLPGGQAQGLGLMAAGVGLKALGGLLGGLGSGNRGTGRGAASTGGSGFTPAPIMREERDTKQETYLQITILGDEVEGGLVRQLDSAARRGMFRNIMATR